MTENISVYLYTNYSEIKLVAINPHGTLLPAVAKLSVVAYEMSTLKPELINIHFVRISNQVQST